MEILNILVALIIIAFGMLGFTRGLTKQIAIFIGTILVLVIAFIFKDILGDILLLNCPFINFLGGIQSLNIIFYQGIAFLVIVMVLGIVLRIIIAITNLFEKILKWTIIFGIPSKILGMIVGFIEGYIVAFCIVFIVSQPFFDDSFGIRRTEFTDQMLADSPILSSFTEDTINVINEVYHLKDNADKNQTDLKIIDMCLDKKIVSVDTVNELVQNGKLKINGIEAVIAKYR
jgi:uncharacterized membrane protein required for colicin V production